LVAHISRFFNASNLAETKAKSCLQHRKTGTVSDMDIIVLMSSMKFKVPQAAFRLPVNGGAGVQQDYLPATG
jgi:hypothetical protein